ncbi:MAG: GDSL family lipase [Oscillospiraceae bacterium]|nr:GDSL family lipase [Oscillospiraceae bacterium]
MKRQSKLWAAALSVLLCSTVYAGAPLQTSAANTEWKFDFGGGGTASGYTGVSASDGYNANRGYGFSAGTSAANVAASGSGALSDAVQFKNSTSNGNYTFCADVPNGLYQVSVWLGNTARTSVAIEGMYQIMNMTGNGAYHTLQVPVTDGQLNICACAGKEGNPFSISALEIKQISTQTHTNPTIWVCGDSTVCNYYPLNSSAQAGWAQMLLDLVSGSGWQVMNMATSGQCARGFVQGGQFNVIEKNGQPGDIYIISIGINDTNAKNNTTAEQYQEIITDMTKRAQAKGMRVILVKQQGRNGDCQRNPLLTSRWYNGTLDKVSAETGAEVVDLFNFWQNDCLKKSAADVSKLYMDDGLHPNRSGATRLAELAYAAMNIETPGVTQPTIPDEPETPEIPAVNDTMILPATGDPLLQGDLNGDGKINAIDLTLAKRAVLQPAPYQFVQAADLNGDLKADSADIQMMIGFLTGAETEFSDTKYAASEQQFSPGVRESSNAGYAYQDYLNLENNAESNVTFAVNVPQTGNYLCTFNIANGSANDRSMMITVNDGNEKWKQNFLSTGAWTTWEERAIVLPLIAGVNRIKLQSNTAEGGPNFDYLKLTFTDEPVPDTYDPSQEQPTVQQPVSNHPTLYVASDSTAQSYSASKKPQQGWGYYLQSYFSANVTVSNHSIAGRSSKSFYDNGRLNSILEVIKPGDYLLIDFGINDGAASQPERYAPVCYNADNPTQGSFEYYMTFYIKGALDKGATPILMSPTLSIKNQTQPFKVGYRNIDTACQALAKKYNIPYFDLGQAMVNDFNKRDYNTVKGYYMGGATGGTDFTHFTETGANVTAQIICNGIKEMGIPLSAEIK